MTDPVQQQTDAKANAGKTELRLPGGLMVRLITILPVIATMAASLSLMVYGFFQTWRFVLGLIMLSKSSICSCSQPWSRWCPSGFTSSIFIRTCACPVG